MPATAAPRRKTAMRLMENARARAVTYAKRVNGLQKKASELATLCDVSVVLVCAPGDGAGAGSSRLVWESKEGVLDRYYCSALPPETRARHTHRSYLEAELGKERAKLARLRQGGASRGHGALADWDPALNDMTLDMAQEVLGSIDAALRAAGDRMVALGLGLRPADGRLDPEQEVAAPNDASDNVTGVALDMGMGCYTGFQPQMTPCHGGNNGGGLLEQFLMQPEYGGLECVLDGSYDAASTVEETQAAGGYGDNADCRWPDLTMCCPADGSWESVVPAGCYPGPELADGALPPEHYCSAQGVTGGDYADTLPLESSMAMDENLAYLDMDNNYAAHWQAQEFQRSHTGQLFHYLY